MIEVSLNGFVDDQKVREEIDNGKGWAEWRTLDLVHDGNVNPEWFDIAACNDYYLRRKVLSENQETHGYVLQDKFNEKSLLDYVRERLGRMVFTDWDDFYKKMSAEFISDED